MQFFTQFSNIYSYLGVIASSTLRKVNIIDHFYLFRDRDSSLCDYELTKLKHRERKTSGDWMTKVQILEVWPNDTFHWNNKNLRTNVQRDLRFIGFQ